MSPSHTSPEAIEMRAATDQETFWAGEFGDAYTARNAVLPEDRVPFLKEVLSATSGVESVLELGANKGHNLIALRSIAPSLRATGVELNPFAFQQLSSIAGITAVQSAIQDFASQQTFDLVFTCGVLIHINPDNLPAVYKKMAALANKYVLINEYFNPTPTEIVYRGHSGKLFKRDFAGEFLDSTEGFEAVRWGFLWKRMEPAWDNGTWTLLRRKK
jgi:pseudaminic acid biosynthesis-associated methylase